MEVRAINGIYSFDLDELKFVKNNSIAITGQNGVGKSTFFQILKNHQKIYFPDFECAFLDQGKWSPLGDYHVRDVFTLLDNLKHKKTLYACVDQYPLIKKWNAEDLLDRPIYSLSGGENQLIKLLTMFYIKSDAYFLDEPTSHLDIHHKENLINLLKGKTKEFPFNNHLMVIIDHDRHFLSEVCQYNFELSNKSELLSFQEVSNV